MASFCDGDKKLYSCIKARELLDKQGIRELVRHYRLFCTILLNLLTPNVNYSGRTAPLTSK